jgi:hypothetical protein
MYYPYLRGKQFELILLRENSDIISNNNFHPIIEPVKEDFTALIRAVKILVEKSVNLTIIVNPKVPIKSVSTSRILSELIENAFVEFNSINIGYLLTAETNVANLENLIQSYPDRKFSIIHSGYSDGKKVKSTISKYKNIDKHIFIDGYAGKLYQKQLQQESITKILIRNGFKSQRKNAHFPASEHFSDLHITYVDEGMDGFGDYSMVGDDYSESGGPAYAVVIHITFLDEDSNMFIYHFLSDQTNSPTDPGGKFLEALTKLIKEYKKPNSKIFKSNAMIEFQTLFNKKHYPGLGYIKKLSMQHHLELMQRLVSDIVNK